MDTDTIILQCESCLDRTERPRLNTFNGHYHQDNAEYVCEKCRGHVHDVTHRAGAVCASDMILCDIQENFMAPESLMPWKVWRVQS